MVVSCWREDRRLWLLLLLLLLATATATSSYHNNSSNNYNSRKHGCSNSVALSWDIHVTFGHAAYAPVSRAVSKEKLSSSSEEEEEGNAKERDSSLRSFSRTETRRRKRRRRALEYSAIAAAGVGLLIAAVLVLRYAPKRPASTALPDPKKSLPKPTEEGKLPKTQEIIKQAKDYIADKLSAASHSVQMRARKAKQMARDPKGYFGPTLVRYRHSLPVCSRSR